MVKKIGVQLSFLLFWVSLVCGQSPKLLCTSVDKNGGVTLTWDVSGVPSCPGSAAFDVYFGSAANGTYQLAVANLPVMQTSYLHSAAGALTGIVYYYVDMKCNGVSNLSNKMSTILLRGIRNGQNTDLSWNNPDPAGSTSYVYDLHINYPANSIKETVVNPIGMSYSDPIIFCASPNYTIISKGSGCLLVSNIKVGYEDITGPPITEIGTVTVDPVSKKVKLSWPVNPAGDTKGYFILKYINPNSNPIRIDQVDGRQNVSYLDQSSDPVKESKGYLLLPYDSCGKFDKNGSVIHHNILLKVASDACSNAAVLTWNKYEGWPGGVSGYEVYENDALVKTLDSNNTSYTRTGLPPSSKYSYYIKAVPFNNAILSSLSNKDTIATGASLPPKFLSVKSVSVTGANNVLISTVVDPSADVSSYRLIRSTSPLGPFEKVLDVAKTTTSPLLINDNTALTQEKSYYYKVQAINTCGSVALTSTNFGRSVFVYATADDDFINTVQWNQYAVDDIHYNVYRNVDGNWQTAPVASLNPGNLSFADDVKNLLNGQGNFCYKIVAQTSGSESSTSNTFCLVQAPRLYVPNAFVPGGVNRVFHPVSVFDDTKTYVLAIYNRWGDKIFETNNPHQGWDGAEKGTLAPQGVYVFMVYFTGLNGEALKRFGTVEMIR